MQHNFAVIDKSQLDESQCQSKIVAVHSVWSNGTKIRRYSGQGKHSEWHSVHNGYRKMIAILVEVEDSEC